MFDAFVKGINANPYGDLAKKLKKICNDDATAWAIATALHDFQLATAPNNDGEEHRTSALMGYFAMSIGVFSRLAELSNMVRPHKTYWHAAPKKASSKALLAEEITGGDFGIAIQRSDGHYNLSFIQAKNSPSCDIDISISSKLTTSKTPEGDSDINLAKLRLAILISTGSFANIENQETLANLLYPTETENEPNYQLFKIAKIESDGVDEYKMHNETTEAPPWCHYVIWSPESPKIIAVQKILKYHRENTVPPLSKGIVQFVAAGTEHIELISEKSQCIPAKLEKDEFSEHLARGFTSGDDNTPLGWMKASLDTASELIGNLQQLGSNWYVADGENGPLVTKLNIASNILKSAATTSRPPKFATFPTVPTPHTQNKGPRHNI